MENTYPTKAQNSDSGDKHLSDDRSHRGRRRKEGKKVRRLPMRQSRQYYLLQIDEHLTPIFRLLGYFSRQLVNDLVRHDAGEHISVEVASDLLKDDEHTRTQRQLHTHTPVAYITKIIDNELYRGLAEFTELIEIHFDRDCTLYFSDT